MITVAALRDLAKNAAARWVGFAIVAGVSLWISHCDGARRQRASDDEGVADTQAKAADDAAKASKHVGDSITRVFADSMKGLRLAKAKADTDAAHALAHLDRIAVVGPGKPPARSETAIGVGEAQPEPDTTKYATIQRKGDPRLYDVPQFVVDLGAELRRAIVEKTNEAEKAERNLAIASSALATDTATIRDLRAAADARLKAENVAKSNAGQSCRIAWFISCPPVWLDVTISAAAGGFAGYKLATLAKGK